MGTKNRNRAHRRPRNERLMQAHFEVTSLNREDLINKEVGFTRRQALAVTDLQMKKIASKMADDYVNQLFWSSLRIIAESTVAEG